MPCPPQVNNKPKTKYIKNRGGMFLSLIILICLLEIEFILGIEGLNGEYIVNMSEMNDLNNVNDTKETNQINKISQISDKIHLDDNLKLNHEILKNLHYNKFSLPLQNKNITLSFNTSNPNFNLPTPTPTTHNKIPNRNLFPKSQPNSKNYK